jgi:aminobenzoyl-glutamate transport protein
MFRQRFGLRVVAIELVIFVIVILLLTAVPQAILLSASGSLFPSSFSSSCIPILAFIIVFLSVSYGLASGTLHTVTDVYYSLTTGLKAHADILLIYILAMQLVFSLAFTIRITL